MNFLSKFLSAVWAMRSDDAFIFASSNVKLLENENGTKSYRKPNGELNIVNNITRRDDGIAVIHVDGALVYRGDDAFWYGLDSYNSIEAAFDECIADESVKGIVFDINSPGGIISGCADLGNKIFEARGSKPYGIVARTGGLMCSAAYWLGSSCEKVYCADNGTLGSIGVLSRFTKWNENFVKTQVVVSDLSPDKSPSPDTPEGLELIKKELNEQASVFVSTVARNRGTTYKDVLENFGKGGCFVGEAAVKAGLADGVISLDALCEQMTKGSNYNGGAVMATNVKGAEGAKPEVDVEAVKAQAIADYKARVASIEGVFAGLEISAEDKSKFIEGNKTVEDATKFALDKAKEKIAAQAEELKKVSAERDDFKSKAEKGPAADANLTAEQKLAIKKGLEADAAAANGVQGGAMGAEAAEDAETKAIHEAFARGMK